VPVVAWKGAPGARGPKPTANFLPCCFDVGMLSAFQFTILAGQPKVLVKPSSEATGHWHMAFLF